jgi:hypothetical protein
MQNKSISIAAHHLTNELTLRQRLAISLVSQGLLLMMLYWFQFKTDNASTWLWSSLSLLSIGSLWYSYELYKNTHPGIKNNGVWHAALTNRGAIAWVLAVFLTGFYVLLYWYPQYLGQAGEGEANKGLIGLFDPLSMFLKGKPASQWFVYGALYTLTILLMGIKFIYKYRHNKYQVRQLLPLYCQKSCKVSINPILISKIYGRSIIIFSLIGTSMVC